MKIDWNYPAPRQGILGVIDTFIGPGATPSEIILQFLLPLFALVAAPIYAATQSLDWSIFQYVVCSILAFDMIGGVVTNSTSTAKRWYHREGQGLKNHLGFVAFHLCHLLLVSWLWLSLDLYWLLMCGAYLLGSAVIILLAPIYLQRPISLSLYCISLMLSLYLLKQPPGLEWFLPLFYLKLLVSHLPREEPYRPVSNT